MVRLNQKVVVMSNEKKCLFCGENANYSICGRTGSSVKCEICGEYHIRPNVEEQVLQETQEIKLKYAQLLAERHIRGKGDINIEIPFYNDVDTITLSELLATYPKGTKLLDRALLNLHILINRSENGVVIPRGFLYGDDIVQRQKTKQLELEFKQLQLLLFTNRAEPYQTRLEQMKSARWISIDNTQKITITYDGFKHIEEINLGETMPREKTGDTHYYGPVQQMNVQNSPIAGDVYPSLNEIRVV